MYADKLFLRDPQGKATDKEQERQREGDKERERENRLREE